MQFLVWFLSDKKKNVQEIRRLRYLLLTSNLKQQLLYLCLQFSKKHLTWFVGQTWEAWLIDRTVQEIRWSDAILDDCRAREPAG